MKKLSRIRLINWQGFFDETLDIEGSTLITGDNGCGKSSLLDALYFILSGGSTKSFNSAASFKSKRNLETYIRGRTGNLSKSNLRDDPFLISHICLQFHDDISKEEFCIGAVLELNGNDQPTKHFYRLKGVFPDDMFQDTSEEGANILDYTSMAKKLMREHNIEIDNLGTTSKDFKRQLKSIICLEDEKYYELLPKAMAFQPIDDINEFAYEFLIPERSVNIEKMRENLKTYAEIRRQIEEDQKKKNALDPIIKDGEKYQKDVELEKLLKAQIHKLSIEEDKNKIKSNETRIDYDKGQIETLERRQESLDSRIDTIQESIYKIKNGEAFQRFEEVTKEWNKAKREREIWQKKVQVLEENIRKEQEIIDALDLGIDLKSTIEKRDFFLLKSKVKEEETALNDKRDFLSVEKNRLERENKELSKELEDTFKELSNLKKGIQSYPRYVDNLIRRIQQSIPEAEPVPLCVLIDVASESWRNALEGYLGDRRFDLFIQRDLYARAASIYENLKANGQVYGVGLVDEAKLNKASNIGGSEDSLATMLTCEDDERVKRYVNLLLGDIQCVDRIDESADLEKAITKDGYVYEDRALRRISEERYSIPYIGPKSLELRKEQLERKAEELETVYRNNADKLQQNNNLNEFVKSSQFNILLTAEDAWAQYKDADNETERLSEELEELEHNNPLMPELKRHEKEKEELQAERDSCISKSTILHNEIEKLPGDNEKLRQQIRENEKELALIMDNGMTSEKLDAFMKENTGNIATIEKTLNRTSNDRKVLEISILHEMKSYTDQFSFAEFVPEIQSLDDFFKEYNNIVNRNRGRFASAEENARRQLELLFLTDYLVKMHNYILEAQDRVAKLNSVLRKRPFGAVGDIYSFEIERSKDQELGELYDLFTSNEDFDLQGPIGFSEEHKRVVDNLFKMLALESNESDENFYKRVDKYLDYRNFMSYDIIIKNTENKRYRFSEINREKSGGETQTPFYVIIAASFDQIFSTKYSESSKGCIVLLDEAFEKMDEAHIESMMEYFKELSIQPFIAVPTQHGRTIVSHVDTAIGLCKSNDRIVPYRIYRKQ